MSADTKPKAPKRPKVAKPAVDISDLTGAGPAVDAPLTYKGAPVVFNVLEVKTDGSVLQPAAFVHTEAHEGTLDMTQDPPVFTPADAEAFDKSLEVVAAPSPHRYAWQRNRAAGKKF
jgi:hypothetical protein